MHGRTEPTPEQEPGRGVLGEVLSKNETNTCGQKTGSCVVLVDRWQGSLTSLTRMIPKRMINTNHDLAPRNGALTTSTPLRRESGDAASDEPDGMRRCSGPGALGCKLPDFGERRVPRGP